MTPTKIYRPIGYVSTMAGIATIVFALVPLLILYGTVDVILFEAKLAAAINRPFVETTSSVGLLIVTNLLLSALFFIGGVSGGLPLMAQFHVREDGFRVKTWFYQSGWLPWTAVQKVRQLPFSNNLQLGIVGLGWMFRVLALVNWLPGGYVVVGSSLVEGEMLVKTIKQKRPDLFEN
ncbi:MAG: hypothetical protein R3D55_07800 [Chloroflexota bacterium]